MKFRKQTLLSVCLLSILIAAIGLGGCGRTEMNSAVVTEETIAIEERTIETENTTESADTTENEDTPELESEESIKTLVVYYSFSGTTEKVAQTLADITDGEIYKIETVRDYPSDGNEVSDEAAIERETGNLPELRGELPDLSEFDRIFVGGPVWTHTVSTPLMSYLSETDFLGKEVLPFWTDAGTPGDYEQDFDSQVQNASVQKGLGITGAGSMDEIEIEDLLTNWIGTERTNIVQETDTAEDMEITNIILTMGNTVVTATLNDSETTREFLATLPRTITMNQYNGREYYGRMETISEAGEAISDYENGDVTFFPGGPSFAVFYAQADSSKQEGLIRMGKITSDLSAFDNLGDTVDMLIEIAD